MNQNGFNCPIFGWGKSNQNAISFYNTNILPHIESKNKKNFTFAVVLFIAFMLKWNYERKNDRTNRIYKNGF